MKINELSACNFMGFSSYDISKELDIALRNGENKKIFDCLHLDFSDGINVFIGENSTGKTSLLKMIYAATQWSIENADINKTRKLPNFFSLDSDVDEGLKSYGQDNCYCYYKVKSGDNEFQWSLSHQGFFNLDKWLGLGIDSVFIPTTEMLSHSKGFLALNSKYQLPFDGTQLDIIVNAQLPELRTLPDESVKLLKSIERIIGGKVVYENDKFYVVKSNGHKLAYEFESDGFRKLGLLYRLILNGSIYKDCILLWDEPEANINPELFPFLVEILYAFEKMGVQLFVSTHNYVFAKYFDLKKEKESRLRFFSLYKKGNEIHSEQADKFSNLKNNPIMTAFEKLLDEVYSQETGK